MGSFSTIAGSILALAAIVSAAGRSELPGSARGSVDCVDPGAGAAAQEAQEQDQGKPAKGKNKNRRKNAEAEQAPAKKKKARGGKGKSGKRKAKGRTDQGAEPAGDPSTDPGSPLSDSAGAGSPLEGGELERDLPPARALAALDNVLCYLTSIQHDDGSWGYGVSDDLNDLGFAQETYYSWNQASNALVLMALMDAPATPEREVALEAGLDWLCRSRMTHRGADWDVDSTWASLYGFVSLVQAAADPRFQGAEVQQKITRRGMEFYGDLEHRQTPDGGWAYYDDRPYTAKPKWATSFCTALVLPALLDAQRLGWAVDPEVSRRAKLLVERCALPNGAYTYSFNLMPRGFGGTSINQVPGSLGRIQVCNWALAKAGEPRITDDVIREGLAQFFEHHAYLDMVRTRPVPHEGWFANAGYFYFFGHFYAAKAISLLPEEERELWHRQIRHHITKTLSVEGSCSDFMASSYQINAGSSFAALVLAAGLPREDSARALQPSETELPTAALPAAEAEQ